MKSSHASELPWHSDRLCHLYCAFRVVRSSLKTTLNSQVFTCDKSVNYAGNLSMVCEFVQLM